MKVKGSDSNITLGLGAALFWVLMTIPILAHAKTISQGSCQDKCKDPSIPKEDMSVCKPKKKGTKLNPKK